MKFSTWLHTAHAGNASSGFWKYCVDDNTVPGIITASVYFRPYARGGGIKNFRGGLKIVWHCYSLYKNVHLVISQGVYSFLRGGGTVPPGHPPEINTAFVWLAVASTTCTRRAGAREFLSFLGDVNKLRDVSYFARPSKARVGNYCWQCSQPADPLVAVRSSNRPPSNFSRKTSVSSLYLIVIRNNLLFDTCVSIYEWRIET